MSRFSIFSRQRRMMTCEQVGEVLQAHLDGEVDELTARRVVRHLDACRRCGMELSVYLEIKASLQRSSGSVDADAVERLRSFGRGLVEGAASPEGSPEGRQEGSPSA